MSIKVGDSTPSPVAKAKVTRQLALVLILALFLLLAALTLRPALLPARPVATTTRDVQAVNPELRQAARYVAPARAAEATSGGAVAPSAANPELSVAQRYAAERQAQAARDFAAQNPELRAAERYAAERQAAGAALMSPGINPEVGTWQRYRAAQAGE